MKSTVKNTGQLKSNLLKQFIMLKYLNSFTSSYHNRCAAILECYISRWDRCSVVISADIHFYLFFLIYIMDKRKLLFEGNLKNNF